MNEDLLTRLADVDMTPTTPPLETIQRRAAAFQRARHGRRLGGVALGVGVLVIGGFAMPPAGTSPDGEVLVAGQPFTSYLQLQPAQAAGEGVRDCDTGSGSWVDPADWAADPDIVRTATVLSDPPFALESLGVHEFRAGCPRVLPVAVLYSTGPVRGVSVWADVEYPFGGVADPAMREVAVRGEAGELRLVNDTTYLAWPGADGAWWLAAGSGMAQDEVLSVVNGLGFDGTRLDALTVPDGFATAEVAAASASTVVRTWSVQYGDDPEVGVTGEGEPQPVAVRDEVTLEVTTAAAQPPEVSAAVYATGVRFVEVNGRRAVYESTGDPSVHLSGRLIWQVDGVSYTLISHHGIDEAVRLASQVEHVGLTDSRVVPSMP